MTETDFPSSHTITPPPSFLKVSPKVGTLLDLHKEEPCADMVRHRAHPDVPMLLEVLRCNHWEEGGQKL